MAERASRSGAGSRRVAEAIWSLFAELEVLEVEEEGLPEAKEPPSWRDSAARESEVMGPGLSYTSRLFPLLEDLLLTLLYVRTRTMQLYGSCLINHRSRAAEASRYRYHESSFNKNTNGVTLAVRLYGHQLVTR